MRNNNRPPAPEGYVYLDDAEQDLAQRLARVRHFLVDLERDLLAQVAPEKRDALRGVIDGALQDIAGAAAETRERFRKAVVDPDKGEA